MNAKFCICGTLVQWWFQHYQHQPLFSVAVPFTARMPIRITIRGHIYDITRLPGGNKRKLQDYSHSRLALRTRTRFLCITTRKRERTYLKLLFHPAAFYRTSRFFASAPRQRFSKKHSSSIIILLRGYATFVYTYLCLSFSLSLINNICISIYACSL